MCSVEGCEKKGRRGAESMCEKHYMRMYRNGTLEKKVTPKSYQHTGGYTLIPAAGHPMALGESHAYEHRVVYYDKYGYGPFKCHWCDAVIGWETLHIDHMDDNKTNNAVENLVPACPTCNQKRGQHKIRETWRKKIGVTAFGETLTLNEWAEKIGINRVSIVWRLKNGWSLEDALSKGRGVTGPKSLKKL